MKKATIFLLVAGLGLAVATAAIAQGQQQGPRGDRMHARLQGAALDGVQPVGRVKYSEGADGPRRLVVSVGRVNLPVGTTLQVNACDGTVGWITLQPGRRGDHAAGRLRLRARDGDAVPDCAVGDPVTVSGSGLNLSGSLKQGRR